MKKRKVIFISVLLLIVTITCIVDYYGHREKKKNEIRKIVDNNKIKKNCLPFTGGSYTLKFDTDGGEEIADMNICIACSPDSYKDIPIPEKEGYTFDGWYSDKKLANKIDYTNTKDLKAIPEYDEDDCMIGYQDITIHAKWSKI